MSGTVWPPAPGDVRLSWDPANARGDVTMFGPFLETGHDLESAVLISLFTDRQADPGDVLPPDLSSDPRGWWADTYNGDFIGSKLWQVMGRVRNPDTLNFAQDAASKSLDWMIADGVASAVDVIASFYGSGGLRLDIQISQPSGVINHFTFVWGPPPTLAPGVGFVADPSGGFLADPVTGGAVASP
jgi:phage gp46-like protein